MGHLVPERYGQLLVILPNLKFARGFIFWLQGMRIKNLF